MIYKSETGDFTATIGGDSMMTRRLDVYDEPEFLALANLFRKADVGFVNLESTVRHWDEGTPGVTQGTYSTMAPALLNDFKWFGINLVSCANNHAFDYGEGGVMATIRHLDEAGLSHAGTGANLSFARAPGYVDTPHGRVGLVAATATFRPWNAAGGQRPDLQGRPGINPLGFKNSYTVDSKNFDELLRLSDELGFSQERERRKKHFYSDKELGVETDDEVEIFDARIQRGKKFGSSSSVEQADLEDNLKWIREARRQADWVIFSLHNHEFSSKGTKTATTKSELEDPADFIKAASRAAIDAGADIVVGHGAHFPLGIEIYKGRPIFYGMGNFIFQNDTVPYFPEPAYSRFDLGPDATPSDFIDARTNNGKKGHPADPAFWENFAAQCVFSKGKLSEIRIHPVNQGYGLPRSQRGRPVLASGKVAKSVLDRVTRVCKQYGTKVEVKNGIGVIRVGK